MQAPRWVLIWRSQGKKKIGCRCRPTRGLSFHLAYVIDWFSTACCLYAARLKSEHTHYLHPGNWQSCLLPTAAAAYCLHWCLLLLLLLLLPAGRWKGEEAQGGGA
jgi:hypothetical protein